MRITLLRLLWLLASFGASMWLLSDFTLIGWSAVISFITIGWIGYTMYVKRRITWSLLSYILTPVLIWFSALSLIFFVREGIQGYLVLFIAVFLSWIWSSTLTFSGEESAGDVFRGNLLSYLNSFIVFFASSSLFAADIFITLPVWVSTLIIFTLSFILHLQVMKASHIGLKPGVYYSLITGFVITELFGGLLFWPSSFFVSGMLVTVMYYSITGVSRCMLTSVLSTRLIRRYISWGFLIIFAILITADWQ